MRKYVWIIVHMIYSKFWNILICHTNVSDEWELPNKLSSWTKLIRVTIFIKRFIRFFRYHVVGSTAKTTGLSTDELKHTVFFCCVMYNINISHPKSKHYLKIFRFLNEVPCYRCCIPSLSLSLSLSLSSGKKN